MIFLDKNNQPAIDFVTEFIDDNWLEQNDGTFKYQNIGYSQVKNPASDFRLIFVNEQNGKCCYCSRDIFNDHSTELEHIIPRTKTNLDDFQPYYELSNVLHDNVIPQRIFELTATQLRKPPFPHHIAYHNIVASCNGKVLVASDDFTCCNRERKDDFVPPFNLIKDSVGYLPDGTIVYMNDLPNRDYFRILNLDKDILNNIRRLWYLFSQSQLALDDVLNDEFTDTLDEKIIGHAIAHSPTAFDDIKLVETFSNQEKWNIFKGYSFFFDYYRNLN